MPNRWRLEASAWLALAALLALLVPLFLCMPLTVDVAFYDLCGRHVLRAGALERDVLLLQLPGMPWALAGVRALLGKSAGAVRATDLAVVAGVVALLLLWLRAAGVGRAGRAWLALPLFALYLTTTEWCHAQPDTWMLLPALAALHLRRRQVEDATRDAASRTVFGRGVLEGLCWGAGCLIKPYVVVPGALAWLAAAALAGRAPDGRRRLARSAAGVLAGGLLVGAVWLGALAVTGGWAVYWHNWSTFSREFYSMAPPVASRARDVFFRLAPWGLLHVPALLIASASLIRAARGRAAGDAALPLLGAFYLGWFVQAVLLQGQFPYHVLPAALLALALIAAWSGATRRRWVPAALVGFGVVAVAVQPSCQPARLALWGRCWREGGSAELKNRLTLDGAYHFAPDWVELEDVAAYLRSQEVGDGEVIGYNLSTTHLLTLLDVEPPGRFLYPSTMSNIFRSHRATIARELRASAARFAVTDLRESGADPPGWPYSEPVVFRAGRYAVHRVGGE